MLTVDLAEDAVSSVAEPCPSPVLRCHVGRRHWKPAASAVLLVCFPEVVQCSLAAAKSNVKYGNA